MEADSAKYFAETEADWSLVEKTDATDAGSKVARRCLPRESREETSDGEAKSGMTRKPLTVVVVLEEICEWWWWWVGGG